MNHILLLKNIWFQLFLFFREWKDSFFYGTFQRNWIIGATSGNFVGIISTKIGQEKDETETVSEPMKRKEIHFCFRVEKKEKKEELEYVPQEPVKIQSISNELFNTIRESLNNPSLGLNSTPSRTMNPPPEPPCKLFFFYNCCTKQFSLNYIFSKHRSPCPGSLQWTTISRQL